VDADNPDKPSWFELEQVLLLPEVERQTSLSRDSLDRHHRHKYVRLSPRRVGMRVRDVLAITGNRYGTDSITESERDRYPKNRVTPRGNEHRFTKNSKPKRNPRGGALS
jgi:hypothetical protein